MISINENIAHLNNGEFSYILEVDDAGYLVPRHFGKSIRNYNGSGKVKDYRRGFSTLHGKSTNSFDNYPLEFPVRSHGDFKIPALSVIQENGVHDIDLKFKDWEKLDEKIELEGLPTVHPPKGEVEVLKVTLEDKTCGIEVDLYYNLFKNLGILTRHNTIRNISDQEIILTDFKSASLELPHNDYEMLTFYGTHMKEANENRFPLHHGVQKISSHRGVSSHQAQPFMAIVTPETNNTKGEVYGLNLVYSGNFEGAVELDTYGHVRAQMGINPDTFEWILKPGEELSTPELVISYSSEGLNKMSQNFHKLYENNLVPDTFKNKTRPLLFNSWEGTYFDVSEEKIKKQVDILSQLGLELYVLDDGWFRNTSRAGMGDWEVIKDKLPNGIEGVADIVHNKGLKFGLWFEPEAVGEISNTIEAHPDWVLTLPGYEKTTGRHEFILDLSRKDVQDYIIDFMSRYLDTGKIDYIKWDMNRAITDFYSNKLDSKHQGEVAHRYVLGLYRIYSELNKKYPKVLIEGCTSGGGRFDPGMLNFVPQIWTSDNSDAFDRTIIQENTSYIYPPITMGAHVSVAPNHQTGRFTPLKTRFDVAKLFNLGYELDVTQLSEEELAEIAAQVEDYKKERNWLQQADFYHHDIPDDNYVMWSRVSPDKEDAMAVIFQKGFNPLSNAIRFKFLGLDPEADYEIEETGEVYGGDELMEIGITVPLEYEDYHTFSRRLRKV